MAKVIKVWSGTEWVEVGVQAALPGDTPDSKTEFKMEPVEANPQESSFNIYRKSNRDEILLAHRVPINKRTLLS